MTYQYLTEVHTITKTLNDVHEILSDILLILKESNNNHSESIEIDVSSENNLPDKLDLRNLDNVVIRSIDPGLILNDKIITGKGRINYSWKE